MSPAGKDEIREVIAQTFVAIGTLARALHVEDARLEPILNAITAHAAAAHPAAKDAFLRRFDLEQPSGCTDRSSGGPPRNSVDPAAADWWTWLIITAYAQLRRARPLAADLRLPWERPAPPGRLTPARVRRGFRNIYATLPCVAGGPKPGKPGPGRPPGSGNRRPAPRHDVGKRRRGMPRSRHERAG
jgi:hypothetical protein